jgi:hypothetical protein
MHHEPGGLGAVGHALADAHQPDRRGPAADADEDAVARGPGLRLAVGAQMVDEVAVHPLGRRARRQLAQRGEVAAAEEAVDRPRRGLGHIDLALAQAALAFLGREDHHLDLVGALQDGVGHGLAREHARDALDHVAEAFEVRHVQRGVDVDRGVEQFLHVAPALGVAAAGDVAVGELVHQRELRAAREQGVEVHLGQRAAAIGDDPARHGFEAGHQPLGLAPSVALDDAGRHVDAVAPRRPGGLEHGVGLAHAWGGAEENLQPPAALAPGLGQQRLRVGAARLSHRRRAARRRARGRRRQAPGWSGGH